MTDCCDIDEGKEDAIEARNYLLTTLEMNNDEDGEIDALAVGVEQDEIDWLREKIVWQGKYDWPDDGLPPGPGWVRKVTDFDHFEDAIKENFNMIFNQFEISAELAEMACMDPDLSNNYAFKIINPIIQ